MDTGDPNKPQYIDNLRKVLATENASIETILLSHWHHDHIGGVKDILPILNPEQGKYDVRELKLLIKISKFITHKLIDGCRMKVYKKLFACYFEPSLILK